MLGDVAFRLVALGHEVHVVCSRQLYEDPAAPLPQSEVVRGVRIHRAWSTRFGRRRLAGRACDYLSFYIGAMWTLWLVVRRNEVLVAKTDPPLLSVPAAVVALLRRANLVNWLQDVFPEVAQRAGMTVAQGRAGVWLMALRDWSLHRASANIVIGERMRELVLARGVPAARVTVIPNGANPISVRPIEHAENALLSEWGLTGRFVVMYSGNMGRAHEFNTILEAARQLRERSDIIFLFVGGGARRSWLEQQTTELPNCIFKDYQPAELLASSLSAGNMHLISLLPDQEGVVVPSKFYGVLAVGRPTVFIGDIDGELARLVNRYQVGTAVAVGDHKALIDAICSRVMNPAICAEEGQRARQVLVRNYTPEQAARAWIQVLERCVKVSR